MTVCGISTGVFEVAQATLRSQAVLFSLTEAIDPTSHAYRRGDDLEIKTAIVLAAAGRAERNARRPAAAQTGVTLQMALEKWHAQDAASFPSTRLDDYTLVNAVEQVHYKAFTGRTEGTPAEIRQPGNVIRLKRQLAAMQCVVALGESAKVAVQVAGYKPSFKGFHPSLQALNSRYRSCESTPPLRRRDKACQWADEVLAAGVTRS